MPDGSVTLSEDLLRSYAGSCYEVQFDGSWHPADTVELSGDPAMPIVLISADNPASQALAESENAQRRAALLAMVEADGYPWLPARGRAPDFSWCEPGLLLRAPLASIDRYARSFGQHAVWTPKGAQPKATLRIYSRFEGDAAPPVFANVELEWVGCAAPDR